VAVAYVIPDRFALVGGGEPAFTLIVKVAEYRVSGDFVEAHDLGENPEVADDLVKV
jgi:hypothetical protein